MTNSFHDLHVTTRSIPRTSIFNLPVGYSVSCHRTTGWELWLVNDEGDSVRVAGEYQAAGLRLDVDGVVLCDSLTPRVQ